MATTNSSPPGGGRLFGLDGLRAVSIALVLGGHALGMQGGPNLSPGMTRWLSAASLGVRIFFVISGFLITTLLLREFEKTGTASLTRFYFRRTLRIFPAFYAYLGIIAVAEGFHLLALKPNDLLYAATYTMNYHADRAWYLGHIWSLSVEEQFYLLWPAMFVLLGPRRAVGIAALFVVASPGIRGASWILFPGLRSGIGETFPTTADPIATGCVLAYARSTLANHSWYQRFLRSPWFWSVPLVVYVADRFHTRPAIDFLVADTVMNVGIAVVIDRFTTNADGPVGRFLNWRPVATLGTMSYSIYLWQQPFMNHTSQAFPAVLPLALVFTVFAAWMSYRLVEKPALALRERLELAVFPRQTKAIEQPALADP